MGEMWEGISSLPVLGDDSGYSMGISLEWAGGSSAPALTPNLTFPGGAAPGKEEAGAAQGTGPAQQPVGDSGTTWEGSAECSMSCPVPGEAIPC